MFYERLTINGTKYKQDESQEVVKVTTPNGNRSLIGSNGAILAKFGTQETVCESYCFACPHNYTKLTLAKNVIATRNLVVIDGKSQKVSMAKFRMLCAFNSYKNKVLSREFLLDYCWVGQSKVINNVNVTVSELRMLVKNSPLEIVTIRNKGYLMINSDEEISPT